MKELTLIFSYIPRLGSFLGFKNLNLIILGVFQIFFFFFWGGGGMKILWIFLGGHYKIGQHLGVMSVYFRIFS